MEGVVTHLRGGQHLLEEIVFTLKEAFSPGWPSSRPHEIPWLFQYRQAKITRYRVFTDMVNSCCFILMKNRVRPDSQLFNSWGCNSWGKGMRCRPVPSRLGGPGERRKLPPRPKKNGKNTPDFTSPDFFHFPWLIPDHFKIPRLFQVFQAIGHPVSLASVTDKPNLHLIIIIIIIVIIIVIQLWWTALH